MSQCEDNLTRIFDCSIKLSTAFTKIVYEGSKRLPLKSRYLWICAVVITVGVYSIVSKDFHLIYLYKCFPRRITSNAVFYLHSNFSHSVHMLVLMGVIVFATTFLMLSENWPDKLK